MTDAPKGLLTRAVTFETRAADDDGFTLEGYAAVFDSPTRIDSWEGRFDEQITRGAFKKTLQRRKPRVVWGHDWNHPIGKVLEVYEVGPNDPRLPTKMRQAGVGGLYAKVQFNLRSEKGKEAFENIVFFGGDQEWSIGYKTLDAVFDPKLQANILKELELYEVSPVLHGANQLTST